MTTFSVALRTLAAFILITTVEVSGSPAFSQSNDGLAREVEIKNETGVSIVGFYASRVATNSWEENILGDRTIEDGESVTINIDDGTGYCLYDFRAIFSDNDVVIDEDVNVCEIDFHRYFVGNG